METTMITDKEERLKAAQDLLNEITYGFEVVQDKLIHLCDVSDFTSSDIAVLNERLNQIHREILVAVYGPGDNNV